MIVELEDGEAFISVSYSTQRDFGNVKVQVGQAWKIDTTEISPADARSAVLETLVSEADEAAERILIEHDEDDSEVIEAEAQVETEDLSEDEVEVEEDEEEEWMKPDEGGDSALTEDELEEAMSLLEEEEE